MVELPIGRNQLVRMFRAQHDHLFLERTANVRNGLLAAGLSSENFPYGVLEGDHDQLHRVDNGPIEIENDRTEARDRLSAHGSRPLGRRSSSRSQQRSSTFGDRKSTRLNSSH